MGTRERPPGGNEVRPSSRRPESPEGLSPAQDEGRQGTDPWPNFGPTHTPPAGATEGLSSTRGRGRNDLLAGLPGSLRAALRAAGRESAARPAGDRPLLAPDPPAAPPGSAAGDAGPRLAIAEEDFGEGGRFPEDLFGPGFRWHRAGTDDIAFFDLETCGLADDPIFLVGVLRPSPGGLRLSRALARDPSSEPALLRWAAAALGPRKVWVTFNGRSFDAPRLRRRASIHEVAFPEPEDHLDLLLAVRRRWKGELPDCRLGTVERRLLKLERGAGDVPGREVPERYRDYVRTGDPRWIKPVLEHNRRDVTAMVVLYARLAAATPSP